MNATDVNNPNYFHKVVDCQWACPAHTNVPEYIRLIAQGRYTDAYMLNRESNVFPAILGRTCDRPCEPACRRGRVDGKPVAICRLKRVAADLRDDITDRLPKIPSQKNGKRIACIGAGPASLTVANDLMPLGYEVVMFEKYDRPGGLMRTNIPAFRLPESVLMDEINQILDMGVEIRYNSPIDSMRALLAEGFDAIFVGTGAPRGKELDIPGRHDTDRIHIGIDWLESIAFGHTDSIGENVLIIGVGNTAMDCCRSSCRLGGKDIKVMARRPRGFFKASPWELEDAEEEGVEIIINHAPTRFVIENGKLIGMDFERLEWDAQAKKSKTIGTVFLPADDVILAIGQENSFPWIERDIGIEFDKWDMPVVDEKTMQCTRDGIFFGGDAAWGPKNIIWAAEHGHQAAISIHNYCQDHSRNRAPAARHEPHQPEDGDQRVELSQRLQSVVAPEDAARRSDAALSANEHRSGAGLLRRTDRARSAALHELRHRDRLRRAALHRMRRLHRHLPGAVPHHHAQWRGRRPAPSPLGTRRQSDAGSLRFRSAAANRAHHGQGRRPVRALRPLR